MDLSLYRTFIFRRDGKVLHAAFNRPETLNAIEGEVLADLERLFKDVSVDVKTNVLVLTGKGSAFSAGGDLDHIQELIDHPESFVVEMASARRLIFSLLDCPKIVIAKINGPAIGFGATIALFCDMAVATHRAQIADPHVNIGLVAGDGGAVIWPQLVGYMRAKEFLLTGDAVTGEEAARIGLISQAVAPEELDVTVDQIAQRLANGALRGVQWTKRVRNTQLKDLAHSVLDSSMGFEVLSKLTKDHQEAVTASRAKRAPKFTGE